MLEEIFVKMVNHSISNGFTTRIYLASKSPRRQMLLNQIGIEFDLIDSEIDESVKKDESALNYVRRMSIQKANEGWVSKQRIENYPLLAADTSIAIDDVILGKSTNRTDAKEMLNRLSSRRHEVITSVSLKYQQNNSSELAKSDVLKSEIIETVDSVTKVKFCVLRDRDIEEYLDTEEWLDKAGSYAIQGFAAKYIESIQGSYSGVVGLPLYETSQLISKMLEVLKIEKS